MSDGHYCIVRDLGLVKGGKGMKHHEVILDFSRRGIVTLLKQLLAGAPKSEPSRTRDYQVPLREPSR